MNHLVAYCEAFVESEIWREHPYVGKVYMTLCAKADPAHFYKGSDVRLLRDCGEYSWVLEKNTPLKTPEDRAIYSQLIADLRTALARLAAIGKIRIVEPHKFEVLHLYQIEDAIRNAIRRDRSRIYMKTYRARKKSRTPLEVVTYEFLKKHETIP